MYIYIRKVFADVREKRQQAAVRLRGHAHACDAINRLAVHTVTLPAVPGHVNHWCAHRVTQLTVSLYLLVQSKLQMRHSMTSLVSVLRRVSKAYLRFGIERIVDRWTLASVYRKARRNLYYHQALRLDCRN